MAKPVNNIYEKPQAYEYPTRFGSHASMIDEEATKVLSDENKVVCNDELGSYTTERKYLDCGMADLNRYKRFKING